MTFRDFRYPRVWLGVWLAGWVLCIALSLLPPVALDAPAGSDKLGHLLAYATLSAWAVQLFATWRAQLAAAASLVVLGALLEVAQAGLTADRLGDPRDAVANTVGVLLGLATAVTPVATWVRRVDGWWASRRG